jgi:hypothetical protein
MMGISFGIWVRLVLMAHLWSLCAFKQLEFAMIGEKIAGLHAASLMAESFSVVGYTLFNMTNLFNCRRLMEA